MREQLIQYVDLLFAGARDSEDMKQEILQNTLDRYDDLIAEGKVPEAAYRMAITGIGDINEILGNSPWQIPMPRTAPAQVEESDDTPGKKLLRAIAIGLYILCPLPMFLLGELGMETLGLCGMLTIVAVATVLIILGAKKHTIRMEAELTVGDTPSSGSGLRKAIKSAINTVGLILYFVISFVTGAWYITWLIFPIEGAVWGLVNAILDLKEAMNYES